MPVVKDHAPLPIPAGLIADSCRRRSARHKGDTEARVSVIAQHAAKLQGQSRRDFLRTGSGMAAALLALNQVFGHCYERRRRRGRGPEGLRGEVAQGSVHFRRSDAPCRCQPQMVRRHADGQAHQASSSMLRPFAGSSTRASSAQPRPLRQGALRRQRHGDGDHQRRAEPRLGQESAAARSDGRHAQVTSTTWPVRSACCRTACCGPISARKNSTRWNARSRN